MAGIDQASENEIQDLIKEISSLSDNIYMSANSIFEKVLLLENECVDSDRDKIKNCNFTTALIVCRNIRELSKIIDMEFDL